MNANLNGTFTISRAQRSGDDQLLFLLSSSGASYYFTLKLSDETLKDSFEDVVREFEKRCYKAVVAFPTFTELQETYVHVQEKDGTFEFDFCHSGNGLQWKILLSDKGIEGHYDLK